MSPTVVFPSPLALEMRRLFAQLPLSTQRALVALARHLAHQPVDRTAGERLGELLGAIARDVLVADGPPLLDSTSDQPDGGAR
jgi:hypothetical protein